MSNPVGHRIETNVSLYGGAMNACGVVTYWFTSPKAAAKASTRLLKWMADDTPVTLVNDGDNVLIREDKG